MVRQVIPLAALGLFLVPDWATATVRRRACLPPVRAVFVPPPVAVCPPFLPAFDACGPAVVYPAPLVLAAPRPAVVYPAPLVLAAPRPAAVAPLAPPAEPPKSPPRVEPDPPPPPVKPAAALPQEPPTIRPPDVPPAPTPKAAPLVLPPADPAAPKVPSLNPVNPGGGDAPPFKLDPPKGSRTSGSSPVGSGFAVRLVPAAGPPPASPDAKRAVRFVNLSGLPVVLTVEGETAELPARHELTATVPASFQWQLNGGEVREAVLPAAAPGADVVIR